MSALDQKKNQDLGQEWWRGATVYQIYPRSFQDTDEDGIGNLKGITQRLDYVASLGVDAIWISPFFTSPMADFGYDVSDYCDVDPIFGSLQDFDDLVTRAKSLNLKVVIDQVYCHTSIEHPWFQESRLSDTNPKSDWYVWAEPKTDGSPPNNWLSVFGGPAWSWNAKRHKYYLHHFLAQQPTLNLYNNEVLEAVIEAGRFWIDRGVDGFRLDALNMAMQDKALRDNPRSPDAFTMSRPFDMQVHKYSMAQPQMSEVVEKLSDAFRAAGGDDFFTVAEIGGADPHETMVAFTKGSDRLSSAYSFDFIGAREADPAHIRETISKWPNQIDQGYPAFAFSNHDCPRVASRWELEGAPSGRAERLYAMIQSAIRGVNFIYQGEELGLPQVEIPVADLVDPEGIANWPNDQGRDGARTPMVWNAKSAFAGFSSHKPWLPIPQSHIELSVSAQQDDRSSILNFFKSAIKLRKQSSALRFGKIEFLQSDPKLVAFVRRINNEEFVCIINLTKDARAVPLAFDAGWSLELSAGLDNRLPIDAMPAHSGLIASRRF